MTLEKLSNLLSERQNPYLSNAEMISFLNEMLEGPVVFFYTKKDGSTRKAHGTLNLPFLKETCFNKKDTDSSYYKYSNSGSNNGYINYYDLEKNDWRKFHYTSLKKVISYS